jgi:hypothetical protein
MGRREIKAKFVCRGRAIQPNEQFKSGAPGHVLCMVGGRCCKPGRFAGTDAEALSDGQQFAAHGKNTCLAA